MISCDTCGHSVADHILNSTRMRNGCTRWMCNCSVFVSKVDGMVTNDMFDPIIEGQVQVLSKKDSDDYISGKLTANDLRRKYFSDKKQKEKIPMQMTASTSGSGKLTVTKLRELLQDIPEEATLSITTENDQRDGAFWSVKAVWGGSSEERHPYNGEKFPIPLRESVQQSQFGDH